MAGRAQDVVLRGYVSGSGSDWQAICLDLDIAAQGQSMFEAKSILDSLVDDYLAEVRTLPDVDQKRLLKRKAPLGLRLSYHFGYALASLFAERSSGDRLSYALHSGQDTRACAT